MQLGRCISQILPPHLPPLDPIFSTSSSTKTRWRRKHGATQAIVPASRYNDFQSLHHLLYNQDRMDITNQSPQSHGSSQQPSIIQGVARTPHPTQLNTPSSPISVSNSSTGNPNPGIHLINHQPHRLNRQIFSIFRSKRKRNTHSVDSKQPAGEGRKSEKRPNMYSRIRNPTLILPEVDWRRLQRSEVVIGQASECGVHEMRSHAGC